MVAATAPIPPLNIRGGNAAPSKSSAESGVTGNSWTSPINVYPAGSDTVETVVRDGAVSVFAIILGFVGFVLWLKSR